MLLFSYNNDGGNHGKQGHQSDRQQEASLSHGGARPEVDQEEGAKEKEQGQVAFAQHKHADRWPKRRLKNHSRLP